jgi:hypothetical protein
MAQWVVNIGIENLHGISHKTSNFCFRIFRIFRFFWPKLDPILKYPPKMSRYVIFYRNEVFSNVKFTKFQILNGFEEISIHLLTIFEHNLSIFLENCPHINLFPDPLSNIG